MKKELIVRGRRCTAGIGVTLTQGGVSTASGKQGVGGVAVPDIGGAPSV